MSVQLYLAFLLACTVVLIIPGPTIMLVVGQALAEGRRAVWASVAGVALGDLTALIMSAAGLGALLSASAELFTLLKLGGALYLIWLGIRTWRAGRDPLDGNIAQAGQSRLTLFSRAYSVTALNPKSIMFFVAFMPQFIAPQAPLAPQLLLLGCTFLVLATLNAAGYAGLAGTIRGAVRQPGIIKAIHRAGGGLLIGAGVWLAVRRPA